MSRFDEYKAFVRAAATGDTRRAQSYVAPRFSANLGANLERLDFRGLMDELSRQRTAFPDLGQTVQYRNPSETDSTLDVDDVTTVTFSGVLESRRTADEQQGDGRVVTITQHHHVEFSAGKIVALVVKTDQAEVMRKLFS